MVTAPEDWAWSSFQATAGLTTAPEFLNTSWVLGQFADHIPMGHRPDLEELLSGQEGKEQRSKAAYQAHVEWGYTLKDIGEILGVHYATVSRMIRQEGVWRCKT